MCAADFGTLTEGTYERSPLFHRPLRDRSKRITLYKKRDYRFRCPALSCFMLWSPSL